MRRLTLCLALLALAGLPVREAGAQSRIEIVDTHAHPVRSEKAGQASGRGGGQRGQQRGGPNTANILANLLAHMDRFGVSVSILLPPPYPAVTPGLYGVDELAQLARRSNGRIAFVAGGESINPLLQATPPDAVTPAALQSLRSTAEAIVAAGAVGFGELALEHFSSGRGDHPYESLQPDHPLLLALAGIAAASGLPIDLHMEAVPAEMPFPQRRPVAGNPQRLRANIAAFERLLQHDRGAKIVWAHAGWDLTGERNAALMRRLLQSHANLFMSLKLDDHGAARTAPLRDDGSLRPDWLALLRDFADRFVIGSDQFYDEPLNRLPQARRLVDALPPDLAQQVASENALRLYRLRR